MVKEMISTKEQKATRDANTTQRNNKRSSTNLADEKEMDQSQTEDENVLGWDELKAPILNIQLVQAKTLFSDSFDIINVMLRKP